MARNLIASFAVGVLLASGAAQAKPITYFVHRQVTNFSLGITITVDGTLTVPGLGNVEAIQPPPIGFDLTFSDGQSSLHVTDDNGSVFYQVGGLNALETQLDFTGFGEGNLFRVQSDDVGAYWHMASDQCGPVRTITLCSETIKLGPPNHFGSIPHFDWTQPWAIARVPEPSTAILLATGILALAVGRRRS